MLFIFHGFDRNILTNLHSLFFFFIESFMQSGFALDICKKFCECLFFFVSDEQEVRQ